jgi:hypothetical protein
MSAGSLDRRAFLGTLTLSGAALLAPWPAAALAGPGEEVTPAHAGHVDDMWGHWPRYAHPIPHGSLPGAHPWERLEPVDRMWGSV